MKQRSYKHMIEWAAKQNNDIYNRGLVANVLAKVYSKDPCKVYNDVEAKLEKLRCAEQANLAKKYRCVTCKDQGWYKDSSACDFGGPSVKISCETCGTGKIIWN